MCVAADSGGYLTLFGFGSSEVYCVSMYNPGLLQNFIPRGQSNDVMKSMGNNLCNSLPLPLGLDSRESSDSELWRGNYSMY